ncbi:MAG: hypothetical protein ACRDKG_06885 [Actinomycetota bacterium]
MSRQNGVAVRIGALLLAVAGFTACSEDLPDGAQPPPTTSPTPPGSAQVVVSHDEDLWLYHAGDDAVRRLTTDGDEAFEQQPRFHPKTSAVSYFVNDADGTGGAIFDLDVSSKAATELVSTRPVRAIGWSPTGDALAYVAGIDDDEGATVYLFDPATKVSKEIRSLPTCRGCGRGIADLDERRVGWSPDGKSILIVDTTLDNDSLTSMFVLDREGKDVVPPRSGTQARWAPDSRTIYYEQLGASGLPKMKALAVATNRQTDIPIQGGVRPAVSPDGRYLAYDDGKAEASLMLFELATGAKRRLARSVVGPIWLAAGEIAATEERPCRGDECGAAPPWFSVGKTVSIELDGSRRGLSLPSTVDADVAL